MAISFSHPCLCSWAPDYHPTVFVSHITSSDLTIMWFHLKLIARVCMFFHREGLWDNIREAKILHQPAGEFCHLQADPGGWTLAALPVLQRIVQEDLWKANECLHPPRTWWEGCPLHGRVQRHFSPHRRKCGVFHSGGKAQRVQLWPKLGAAGEDYQPSIQFMHTCIFKHIRAVHIHASPEATFKTVVGKM